MEINKIFFILLKINEMFSTLLKINKLFLDMSKKSFAPQKKCFLLHYFYLPKNKLKGTGTYYQHITTFGDIQSITNQSLQL